MPLLIEAAEQAVTRELTPADVTLVAFHLDDDRDVNLSEAAMCLSNAELLRATRFVHDRDQKRYIRSRGFLRKILGRAVSLPAQSLILIEGPHGKPKLTGCSAWRTPQFNLTHSGATAVVAISWSGQVGVDIEFRDRQIDPLHLANTVLNPQEARALWRLTREAALGRFLLYWTAKEARMKFTGEGMSLDPKRIALEINDGQPVGFRTPLAPLAALQFPDLGMPDIICALVTCAASRNNAATC